MTQGLSLFCRKMLFRLYCISLHVFSFLHLRLCNSIKTLHFLRNTMSVRCFQMHQQKRRKNVDRG
uniref:Uncharacterized protein n=1 Tax=Triticum urartu TaxID=4572 RepID=A0A8R7P172_TRIUA